MILEMQTIAILQEMLQINQKSLDYTLKSNAELLLENKRLIPVFGQNIRLHNLEASIRMIAEINRYYDLFKIDLVNYYRSCSSVNTTSLLEQNNSLKSAKFNFICFKKYADLLGNYNIISMRFTSIYLGTINNSDKINDMINSYDIIINAINQSFYDT